MRIVIFLALGLFLSSCDLDVGDDFYFERVPAQNIQTPDNTYLNTSCELTFDYQLPNGCYNFYDIDYVVVNDTVRVITPFAKVENGVNCTSSIIEGSYSFQFRPTLAKTYIFKFWTGTDDLGNDLFEEYELEID
jgi:ABC-type dipeptide/oligopeptide/nickel transport system permease subunit